MTYMDRSAPVLSGGKRGPIRAVLATPGRKADGVDLDMMGVRLARYRANPVLMVSHNIDQMPIGRVADIQVSPQRITGELVFSKNSALARQIEADVREGNINAVSMRFETHDLNRSTGKCTDWTMVENSVVSVPLDQDALIYQRSAEAIGVAGTGYRRRWLGATTKDDVQRDLVKLAVLETLLDWAERRTRAERLRNL